MAGSEGTLNSKPSSAKWEVAPVVLPMFTKRWLVAVFSVFLILNSVSYKLRISEFKYTTLFMA